VPWSRPPKATAIAIGTNATCVAAGWLPPRRNTLHSGFQKLSRPIPEAAPAAIRNDSFKNAFFTNDWLFGLSCRMDHRRREPDQAAKIAAIEDGRKVSGMVEELLERWLEGRKTRR